MQTKLIDPKLKRIYCVLIRCPDSVFIMLHLSQDGCLAKSILIINDLFEEPEVKHEKFYTYMHHSIKPTDSKRPRERGKKERYIYIYIYNNIWHSHSLSAGLRLGVEPATLDL